MAVNVNTSSWVIKKEFQQVTTTYIPWPSDSVRGIQLADTAGVNVHWNNNMIFYHLK